MACGQLGDRGFIPIEGLCKPSQSTGIAVSVRGHNTLNQNSGCEWKNRVGSLPELGNWGANAEHCQLATDQTLGRRVRIKRYLSQD
ncbi:hypothetical protein ACQ4M4_28055 [Leptolyngbya sp. AN02str]|uniref:hypothetical protein n=1 Tax=Leptolyngbya sp. AN02str TaxID=3423363 RepID=UPI003D3175F0